MTTPKTLKDAENQEYTLFIQQGQNPELNAEEWFQKAGIEGKVKVNYLFRENGYAVYECYTDPGSVDYLYIIASL